MYQQFMLLRDIVIKKIKWKIKKIKKLWGLWISALNMFKILIIGKKYENIKWVRWCKISNCWTRG